MNPLGIGILCLVLFLVLMFLGMPIGFAMLFGGVTGLTILMSPSAAAQMVAQDFISNFSSYAITVAPMFGLMGFLANYSGIGKDLFNTLNVFTRHRKGGLATATQITCALFGAICGAVPATIATMCTIAYPEMRERGYSSSLAGNSIAAGAQLSVLIPPSTLFIVYSMATGVSVGKLFISGIGPGILLMVLNIIAIKYIGWKHPEEAPKPDEKLPLTVRIRSLFNGNVLSIIIIFVVSMGGLFAGIFTPTEAGSIGALVMLIITIVTKQVNFRKFIEAVLDGVRLMSMIYIMMTCASIFGRMFTVSGVPTALGKLVNSMDVPRWTVMAVIVIIYFGLGMVTDLIAMILITMPIFYPIITQLGYDPVWFGALCIIIINTGMLTPPVGSSIFVTAGCIKNDPEATIGNLFKGCWPFVIALLVSTALMIAFPVISTGMVSLIYK